MKVVLACGGTGGHVFPALAVFNSLREGHGAEGVLVGRAGGLEERLAREAGLPFAGVPAVPLHRSGAWRNLALPWKACRAFRAARAVLRGIQPDVVLATGGYVSLPTGAAARSLGIPVVVHESNAHPGVANRLLARLASRVFAGSPVGAAALGGGAEVSGNPARALDGRTRETCREALGLAGHERFLVVLGGSQGARGVNRILASELDALLASGWRVLWQAGPAGLEDARAAAAGRSGVRVEAFVSDIYGLLNAADLALTRSGASTLAELALHGLPAVLVPFPFATGNHQESNARELAEAGAAELLTERDWVPGRASEALENLMSRREAAARAMSSFARPDAASRVADAVAALARPGSPS